MDEEPVAGSGWMAVTAGQYQTKVTIVAPLAGSTLILVKPDPRRWYIRITGVTAVGNPIAVGPDPPPANGAAPPSAPNPIELKFRDAPALVTGAWWVNNAGALTYSIWEQLYVGG